MGAPGLPRLLERLDNRPQEPVGRLGERTLDMRFRAGSFSPEHATSEIRFGDVHRSQARMPGLFGVIQTRPASRIDPVHLASEMGNRLTVPAGQRILRRTHGSSVLGRYGADFHHGTPWSEDVGTAVVAGFPDCQPAGRPLRAAELEVDTLRNRFALALEREGEWILAVDRYASTPIYYAEVDGLLLFASEVKALLAHPDLSREPDEEALATFLSCGHLISDQTLFRAVRRLRGGHMLRLGAEGTISIQRYWRFRPGARAGEVSATALQRDIGDKLLEATGRAMRNTERSVILLSGGMDSRSLLCAALEAYPARDVQAVTFAGEGGDNSDVECAARLAKAAGIRHYLVQRQLADYAAEFPEMNAVIDGLSVVAASSPNSFRQYRALAETGIRTVLRGDEPLNYGGAVDGMHAAAVQVGVRRMNEVTGLAGLVHPARRAQLLSSSDRAYLQMMAEMEGLTPDQAREVIGVEHRLQTFLATSAAYKSVYLNHRAPLLDDGIIDLMEYVSDEDRIDKRLFERAMRSRYPKLFSMPFAKRWSMQDDWAAILTGPTPAGTYLLQQLQDRYSSFWELVEPSAVLALVETLRQDARSSKAAGRRHLRALVRHLRTPLKAMLGTALRQAIPSSYRPRPHVLLLRVIALKHWHDELRTAPAAALA
jgi:asparagine synthetase B (glutamine-hydrolysing)